MYLRILGDLGAWHGDQPVQLGGEKPQAILGLLAVQPGIWVSRAAIVDAVWGSTPPAAAQNLVQTYVSRLRRGLTRALPGPERTRLLTSMSGCYRLEVEVNQLDLLAFRQLAAEADAARSAGALAAAYGGYAGALALSAGTPLANLGLLQDYPAVTAIADHYADVVLTYADVAGQLGRDARALPYLRALVQREPLNEKACARLMLALTAEGQQAVALRVYAELVARLDDELGVRPGAALAETHLRVLRGQIPAPPGSGYRRGGLRAVAGVVPRQLPAAARHFTGRAAQLRLLGQLLDRPSDGAAMVISAICGPAGVGKTALAVHWAHQVSGRFPDGQLYANLRGFDPSGVPITPAKVVRGFLDAMGVPADQISADLGVQIGMYRSLVASKRILILLDNASDEAQVRPLLPGGPGCFVLVTSRRQLGGLVAIDDACPVILDVLTEDESRELLASMLGAVRVASEPAAVTELIALTARLPLGLAVAGARAQAHPDFPLSALLAELRDTRLRLG